MNTKSAERQRLVEELRELQNRRDLVPRDLVGGTFSLVLAALDWKIGELEAELEYLDHGSPF